MYDKNDPRAALAPAQGSAPPPTAFAGAEFGLFYKEPPQEDDANGRTWYTRGQNFIVAFTEAKPGASFARQGQIDEYTVLLPNRDTPADIMAGASHDTSPGYEIVFVPPGDSTVRLPNGGRLVRLFSTRSPELNARCANAAAFTQPQPNIPPYKPWPTPKGGFKIRRYTLDVPDEPGRFGRIWRCTTMMVNYLAPQIGPRDITKLSPHHHDDFEQGSLALEGAYIHHLRWPWTVDMRMWRDDLHAEVASPSLTVIPPPAIHTSRGMRPGVNQLVDIFAPPRVDFSMKPSWVLNAADYPMP